MFETCAAVDAKVVEGGFDDVVCFGWGDCHGSFCVDSNELLRQVATFGYAASCDRWMRSMLLLSLMAIVW